MYSGLKEQAVLKDRYRRWLYSPLIAFSTMINESFSIIERKNSLRLSVFDAERMYFSLLVLVNHLRVDVRLT